MKWVRVTKTGGSQDPHPQVSDSQVGGISKSQSYSLRSEGCELHVKIPSLRPYIGKVSSITFGFENQWHLCLGKLEGYMKRILHS